MLEMEISILFATNVSYKNSSVVANWLMPQPKLMIH